LEGLRPLVITVAQSGFPGSSYSQFIFYLDFVRLLATVINNVATVPREEKKEDEGGGKKEVGSIEEL
jgi:hypothetical protein